MNSYFNKEKLLEKYPAEFIAAYGSRISKQKGYAPQDRPMIDLIFGVESTLNWHKNNLKRNAQDYANVAKLFGINFIELLQRIKADIYYNCYISIGEEIAKYGVISLNALIEDLEQWKNLYVAGRLQKPVKILKDNERIEKAIKKNLEHAVNVALLKLPETFREEELYMKITEISYIGDIRMILTENPKKIENIVNGNLEGFHELYKSIIKNKTGIALLNGKIQQDKSPETQKERYLELPKNLRNCLNKPLNFEFDELQKNINSAITKIVCSSSATQTIKGLFTVGLSKSVRYFLEKSKKRNKTR